MSAFTEPTTSLEDQLRKVSEYDEAPDDAAFARAIDCAGFVLRALEAIGFPRPYAYPCDAKLVAEWPGDWDVSLHIEADGSMWAHALKHSEPKHAGIEASFEIDAVVSEGGLCDWLHPLLTLVVPNNRLGRVLQ